MIKHILVGIDTSEHSRGAQSYAFYLARRLGATLMDARDDIVSIEGPLYHDISGSLRTRNILDLCHGCGGLTERGRAVLRILPPPRGASG